MGCCSSKEGNLTTVPPGREHQWKPWRSPQHMMPSPADMRLVLALQDLKRHMDEEQSAQGAFSFTKIILRLGTIERVLKRVKVVFRSVDHGNKGHVTKEELMEGLHKAKVDLGEEWKDTNIDECLEHLGEGGGDHDRVGLREFVVMLAVGRVCRPTKGRSSIFVPLSNGISGDDPPQRKERPAAMTTIKEDEARRVSMGSADLTAIAYEASQPLVESEAGQGGFESTDRSSDGTPAAAAADEDEKKDECRAERDSASESAGGSDTSEQLRASAGPGGLPRGSSWRNLKWARIPPLRSLDVSGRPTRRLSRSRSSSALAKGSEGQGSEGVGGEGDVSASVKYVLDLFIAAYFQFDTKARGYITRRTIEKKLRQAERESGTSSLLDQKRWSELAWDDDRLSFQEFIFAFAQWLGLPEDDEDDDEEVAVLTQSEHSARRRTLDGTSGHLTWDGRVGDGITANHPTALRVLADGGAGDGVATGASAPGVSSDAGLPKEKIGLLLTRSGADAPGSEVKQKSKPREGVLVIEAGAAPAATVTGMGESGASDLRSIESWRPPKVKAGGIPLEA